MPKIRKLDIVMVSVFLAFIFTWHYRADLVDVWRVAAATNAALALQCE